MKLSENPIADSIFKECLHKFSHNATKIQAADLEDTPNIEYHITQMNVAVEMWKLARSLEKND